MLDKGSILRSLKLFIFAVLISTPMFAFGIPQIISYQGKLNDKNGVPVQGSVTMTFTIYSSPSGTTALWNETQAINVSGGIFKAELGSVQVIPDTVFLTDSLYLGIQIGSDAEMIPRQSISSSAYAFKARYVEMDMPVGTIMAWAKNIKAGLTLPRGWAECNGQVLNDSESILNGVTMPALNNDLGYSQGGRFLRGAATSGNTGGTETHIHGWSNSVPVYQYGANVIGQAMLGPNTSWNFNAPSYYSVVYIIKVK